MQTIKEPAQNVPVIAEVDVAVVGGGTAGIGAALAAARAGANTMLVEAHGSLGGQMTLGYVNMIPGWGYEIGSPTYGGVMTELLCRLKEEDAWWGAVGQGQGFDVEACKAIAVQMLQKCGVRMRLHSWVSNAVVKDRRIKAIIVDSVDGRKAIVARSFVDTSGDAVLAHVSGAEYEVGRMAISSGGIGFIPDPAAVEAFCQQHKVTSLREYLKQNGYAPVDFGGAWNKRVPGIGYIGLTFKGEGKDHGIDDSLGYNGQDSDLDSLSDGLNVENLTRVENETRLRIKESINFLRANVPGCENMIAVNTSDHLGVRWTRLVKGDYQFSRKDIKERTRFTDCVARCGAVDEKGNMIYSVARCGVAYSYFEIPYRAIYSRNVDNLWVGGRCMSSCPDNKEPRIIPHCVATGEAAGTAAALAAKAGTTARNLNVEALVDQLIRQGVALRDQTARRPQG